MATLDTWEENRPEGMLFLSYTNGLRSTPQNPCGWRAGFDDGVSLDMATDDGKRTFRAYALKLARQAVATCKALGGRSVVCWDWDNGASARGPYGTAAWFGDPVGCHPDSWDLDGMKYGFADQFFRVFTDAGVGVGMTIRHSAIVRDHAGHLMHLDPQDPQGLLNCRIGFAYERWAQPYGAQFTIFRDSNVRFDKQDASGTLPANYETLAGRLPDTLACFEHWTSSHWLWGLLFMGETPGTPLVPRGLNPKARCVFRPEWVPASRDAELIAALQAGHKLTFNANAGSDYPVNARVASLYQQAGGGFP